MKLVCALVNISLVLNVVKSDNSTNSDKKAVENDEPDKKISRRSPILWNKYIGNILQGQEVPHLYCCNMPVSMQSCICCANVCGLIPPRPPPPPPPPPPPTPRSCCHLPIIFQRCDCCPSACEIIIPPLDCCHLPKPLRSCSCCPSECYIPPFQDCCDLPEPFRDCSCCPSACRQPHIPLNRSCCHWPEFLQTCNCCVDACRPPTTTSPAGCCDLPKEFQACECCPDACDDPEPLDCCDFPPDEISCDCCPSACQVTTTPIIKTTPKTRTTPKRKTTHKTRTTPKRKTTHKTRTTPKRKTTHKTRTTPKRKTTHKTRTTPKRKTTHKTRTTPKRKTTHKTKTTPKPRNCCHLPKHKQKCDCCPRACTTTTSTTTESPDCCHLPPEYRDCDCCPSACEQSTTTSTDTTTTSTEAATIYPTPTTCCNWPKELQTCDCCPEACQKPPRNCCKLPKKHRKCSCCPSECKVSTTTESSDCCHLPPDEQDCECCPSACEISTTTSERSARTSEGPSTATDGDVTITERSTTTPSGTTVKTTTVATTLSTAGADDPPTRSTQLTSDVTWTEIVTTDAIITTTAVTEHKTDESSTTETTISTTKEYDCCDAPKEKQNCTCCPELCNDFTSITVPTDCCHIKGAINCHCCPSACQQSTTPFTETTATTTTEDTTLITLPDTDCCNDPQEYVRCSCCPKACDIVPDLLSYKGCCNWPKHLQKCDCCMTVCLHPSPDRTSCCYLPQSMQHCWCCATSSRCFKRIPTLEPSNRLRTLLTLPLSNGLPDNTPGTVDWRTNHRAFYEHRPETWLVKYPKIVPFVARLFAHKKVPFNAGYKEFPQVGYDLNLSNLGNLVRSEPVNLLGSQASGRRTNDMFSGNELILLHAINDLELDLLRKFIKGARDEDLPKSTDVSSDLVSESELGDSDNTSSEKFDLKILPFERGAYTDYPRNWLGKKIILNGVNLDTFLYQNLHRLFNSQISDKISDQDKGKDINLYSPPTKNDNVKTLEKLAKIATGVAANHGEVEFGKSKNMEDLIFESFANYEHLKYDPIAPSPHHNNKNLDSASAQGYFKLHPWLHPYVLHSSKSGEGLDLQANRMLTNLDEQQRSVFGQLLKDVSADISSRVLHESDMGISDIFYPSAFADQSPLKISVDTATLDMAPKTRQLVDDPDDSKLQKRTTKRALEAKNSKLKEATATNTRRIKRSSFYKPNASGNRYVGKRQNPCLPEEINELKCWISKFVRPYNDQEGEPVNKFYSPLNFGLDYNSYQKDVKEDLSRFPPSQKHVNTAFSKSTRWPVVYGTKDSTELDISQQTTTPASKPKDVTDEPFVEGDLQGSLPLVVLIPQVFHYNRPYNPYLRPPLNFPLQYCFFNYYTRLCQELMSRVRQDYVPSTYPRNSPELDQYLPKDAGYGGYNQEWFYRMARDAANENHGTGIKRHIEGVETTKTPGQETNHGNGTLDFVTETIIPVSVSAR